MLLEYLWRRAKVVMRRNHALQNEKAGIHKEYRPSKGRRSGELRQGVVCAQRTVHCDATDGATYGSDSIRALLFCLIRS